MCAFFGAWYENELTIFFVTGNGDSNNKRHRGESNEAGEDESEEDEVVDGANKKKTSASFLEEEEEETEGEDDIAEITEEMTAMKLKGPPSAVSADWRHYPLIIWTWKDEEKVKRCSVDLLLYSGITADNLMVSIEAGGKYVKVEYLWPDTFLNSGHLTMLLEGMVDASSSEQTELAAAIADIRSQHDYEPVKNVVRVKLPFPCETQFVDGEEGKQVAAYENDDSSAKQNYYYILHLRLRASEKPREDSKKVTSFKVVGSPNARRRNFNRAGDEEEDHDML